VEFRWNYANVAHIAEHGVRISDAEFLVEHPTRGYPRHVGDQKFLVRGRTATGLYAQVAYIFDPPGVVYVIHCRPLTDSEKRRLRRGNR
jgi:uncharacterized DUF497 family protein